MRSVRLAAITIAVLGLAERASADFITNAGGVGEPSKTIVFGTGDQFTAGPVQVGTAVGENITWSSTVGFSVVNYASWYGLVDNGSWDGFGTNGYTGLNTDVGEMTFRFLSGLVSQVGGFINYALGGYSDVIISAYDINGNLLEAYNVNMLAPISTPGGTNEGAFRGISRATNDIAAFSVSNGYVVLDNLKFSRLEVEPAPLPPTAIPLGIGALVFAFFGRRLFAI